MKVPGTVCFPKNEYRKLIANVVFRLVIPTLAFSTLIYIPKMIFHGNPLSFGQYLHDVWGGTSYWFTSALSVAQILLAVLLLNQYSHMAFYVVACTLLSLLGIYLRGIFPSPFPWYYQTGMVSTLLMSLGGVYLRYESRINKLVSKTLRFRNSRFCVPFLCHDYESCTSPRNNTGHLHVFMGVSDHPMQHYLYHRPLTPTPSSKMVGIHWKKLYYILLLLRGNAGFIRQHYFATRSRCLVRPYFNRNFHCPTGRNWDKPDRPTIFSRPYRFAENPISQPASFA